MKLEKLTQSPLDPFERTITARYKILRKLEDDYKRITNLFRLEYVFMGDDYIDLHVKVPSEPFREKLFYDVVFRFYNLKLQNPPGGVIIGRDSDVFVFSNNPNFTFTFLYIYNKNGILHPELLDKCPKIALTTPPNKTNPRGIIGYDKSIFYGMLYLRDIGVFERYNSGERLVTKLKTGRRLLNKLVVAHCDDIVKLYNSYKKQFKEDYKNYTKRNRIGFF
jgi:hypothetical protein